MTDIRQTIINENWVEFLTHIKELEDRYQREKAKQAAKQLQNYIDASAGIELYQSSLEHPVPEHYYPEEQSFWRWYITNKITVKE